MKKNYLIILLCFVVLSCNRNAHPVASKTKDYAVSVRSALNIYGWDINGYFFRATPVGNFGIGTMYLNETNSTDAKVIESSWLLSHPSIWFEDAMSNDQKNALLNRIIINGSYGSAGLNESFKNNASVKVGLPLFEVLNVGAGVNLEKGVVSSISADEAILRRIIWPEFEQAILNNKLSASVIRVYNNNNYLIAASDIVLKGYKVTIEVDRTLNPELDLKLNSAVGTVIGKDGFGQFEMKRTSEGKYEAIAKDEVVAALIFKKPPPFQDRSGNVGEWKTVEPPLKDINKIESFLKKQ